MNDSAADNLEAPLAGLYQITRVIADTASDAIITIDEESTMLFVNRAAERIFGYPRAELLGQSLTMLMPDYLRHVHRAGMQHYLATGQRHTSWEAVALPGLHKSGREIPLELSFGEFTENGRRFFTGIARDITERRRLERRLTAQFQVARILAESDSLADGGPRLLQAICESLGWEMGQLWDLDREAEVLRWLAAWRVPSASAPERSKMPVETGHLFAAWVCPDASGPRGRRIGSAISKPTRTFPRGPFATNAGSAFGLWFSGHGGSWSVRSHGVFQLAIPASRSSSCWI